MKRAVDEEINLEDDYQVHSKPFLLKNYIVNMVLTVFRGVIHMGIERL